MKNLVLITLVFFFYSCSNVIENSIKGGWSIDTISNNTQELISCLSLNVFEFKEIKCTIPANYCDTITQINLQQTEVPYTVRKTDNGYYLKFSTESIFFTDSFKVTFFKDTKEKLLKANLKSENIEIIMRKGMYNFDRNIKNTDKLIELTN